MTHDMTEGHLLPIILKFTLPLILANILQLTYNAVDSIIVGRFVSPLALAAVGTSNPIITLVMMFMQGVTLGSGILIGNYFGARDTERLKRQISTAMLSGGAFSLIIALIILLLTDNILGLIQLAPEVFPYAAVYLKIVGVGLLFNYGYNFLANTLRALGDSRSALYFLGMSAVLNVFGDLFFVLVLGWGIVGAAVSTVICEGLSFVFCLIYIMKRVPILNMGREWFFFDMSMLKRTLQYGFVSALQQSTVQLGIVGVQGLVNSLGATATAAFSAANRIDDFALIPCRNISNAMTSVMAQNMGAKRKDRVRDSFKIGISIDLLFSLIAGVLLLLFSDAFIGLFTKDQEIIREGSKYLHLIAMMYVLPSVTNCLQGYFRGVGELKITLSSSLINMGARFLSCFIYVSFFKLGIRAVPWACFTGWVIMLIYELPYFFASWRRNSRSE